MQTRIIASYFYSKILPRINNNKTRRLQFGQMLVLRIVFKCWFSTNADWLWTLNIDSLHSLNENANEEDRWEKRQVNLISPCQ